VPPPDPTTPKERVRQALLIEWWRAFGVHEWLYDRELKIRAGWDEPPLLPD
jgi:hypothetical protein